MHKLRSNFFHLWDTHSPSVGVCLWRSLALYSSNVEGNGVSLLLSGSCLVFDFSKPYLLRSNFTWLIQLWKSSGFWPSPILEVVQYLMYAQSIQQNGNRLSRACPRLLHCGYKTFWCPGGKLTVLTLSHTKGIKTPLLQLWLGMGKEWGHFSIVSLCSL